MIFPILELEPIVQVNDKTRLIGLDSFVSKDESSITLVEIEPELGAGFIDVTGSSSKDWYLDWAYSGTSRLVDVSLRITTDGSPVVLTKSLSVLTVSDDKLFCNDSDLKKRRHDILDYAPSGRSGFLNVCRQSRDLILTYLDEQGYTDNEGNKLTADSLLDVSEVRDWSIALALKLIFEDLSNTPDDKFFELARVYESEVKTHRQRTYLRYDKNNDGTIDNNSEFDFMQTVNFKRR